ncbi:tetratricopeptide repeat protein [uncultured Winogradskyella sp.]|uniref:tetratricopeptide repeat protein n=1 Tax=uncultured Winogradskyella sp. TaxID=395353 RepID=UPI00260A95BA|nr:tetratricopeptide repeat protein [uncultured Winogradskyella sp.]|tara:strand:+ start:2043 stop:3173 length:1131 start_codon:yes stop_codon:yes gene_type:complete
MKYLLCWFYFIFSFDVSAQDLKQKADDYYANGKFTKAIETYKSVKNLDDVYDDIAKSYMAIGNYDKALTFYELAKTANEDNLLVQYEYAKLLTRTKKYEKANQLFSSLIELDSLNPNYYYQLGLVLEKQKDTLAILQFNKTYSLDKTHQKAIFKIAKQQLIKRNFLDAHRIIDTGLESYENNVELISLKAQTYYHQEFYTHAIVWFKKLLALGEKSEFIHEKISLSYAQNSDYEDAIYHRKQALNYNPYDANAMYVIGTYYVSLNNFEKAEDYVKQALFIQDQSLSEEYQYLGTILNRQKKYEDAIKAFKKSLKEDPTNMMSEFFLLRTKDEYYGDLDSKITLYEQFIEKHEKSYFITFAQKRLKELKEEKFLEKK